MRDFLLPLFGLNWFFAATTSPLENPLWERLLEKWGIAFIGIGLLFLFAKRTDRLAKEEQDKRDKQEAATTAERNALLVRNNELQEEQIANQKEHARTLVKVIKDGNKVITDSESATRMLMRHMDRPCVRPFLRPEESETPEQQTETTDES